MSDNHRPHPQPSHHAVATARPRRQQTHLTPRRALQAEQPVWRSGHRGNPRVTAYVISESYFMQIPVQLSRCRRNAGTGLPVRRTKPVPLAWMLLAVHVSEYGRDLWDEKSGRLAFEDMRHIAEVQIQREESAALRANRFAFCDTSPLTTLFYSHHLFGKVNLPWSNLQPVPTIPQFSALRTLRSFRTARASRKISGCVSTNGI